LPKTIAHIPGHSNERSHEEAASGWLVYLLVASLALSFARGYIQDFVDSRSIGGRLICSLSSPKDDFANIEWDQLCYIPRMNAASLGQAFADPWNSHNPAFTGWGSFGLFPALAGGLFVRLFDNFFLAMASWSLVNFTLIAVLLYRIFRSPPFRLQRHAAMLAMCFLMHFPWFSVQPPALHLLSVFPLFGSFIHSQTDIEAGLFTHLPFVLFLFLYWRFAAQPTRSSAVMLGAGTGFLTYVYYFHYIFAFAMVLAYVIVKTVSRKSHEALLGCLAMLAGLISATPFLINNALSAAANIANEYIERLAYEAGRIPLADYRWLGVLWLPAVIAILLWRRRESPGVMLENFWVLALAFWGVLSLRLIMGFGVATDHYWRQSLGIPATLWSAGVVASLIASRRWRQSISRLVHYGVILLPLLIFVRTGAAMVVHFQRPSPGIAISAEQQRVLEAVECLDFENLEGKGFMSTDIALNYLAMVNLKSLPFVPMGLSPTSLEAISNRYLMALYLTGGDMPHFNKADRTAPAYIHAQDPELYLYINLLQNLSTEERDQTFRAMYEAWNSETFDWASRSAELASVRIVYVDSDRATEAESRLGRFYNVESRRQCGAGGSVIQVSAKY
jgi:hypothetical protein